MLIDISVKFKMHATKRIIRLGHGWLWWLNECWFSMTLQWNMMGQFPYMYANYFTVEWIFTDLFFILSSSNSPRKLYGLEKWTIFLLNRQRYLLLISPVAKEISYMLRREYRVVGNQYLWLLFTGEDPLCANLLMKERQWIWGHNTSTSHSHCITCQLWWRHYVKSE